LSDYTLDHLSVSNILRIELEKVLAGPGVTWNMKGILNAYDKALAVTAFKVSRLERAIMEKGPADK